jgi:Flp pilus assembly protein TadD
MKALVGKNSEEGATVETLASHPNTDLAIRYRNQAIVLLQRGNVAESERYSREALRLRPDDVDILNELGVALWRQGRAAEAEAIYLRACEIAPNDFRILTNLGLALYSSGRLAAAGDALCKALELVPDTFDAVMNLGLVRSDEGSFDLAAQLLLRALELRPQSADVLQNIGMNLSRQGRWDEAVPYQVAAAKLKPEHPEIRRNLAYTLLCCGDYERGWTEHEWRLKCEPFEGHRINRPFWNGDRFPGRTLLVHAEGGYGDTLQFVRYASQVKRRGGQVTLLCPGPLLRLLARCEGVDLAFDGTSYIPDCHVQVPMLSLPAIFGTTIETVPAQVPYFMTDATLVNHWRTELARALAGDRSEPSAESAASSHARPFLIGIAWQGNPSRRSDDWRSFPLRALGAIASLPGVKLVNLQVEHGLDQLRECGGELPVMDLLGARKRDFADTAALVAQLDLVIAPDSAVAHLAGGLGLPVWVGLCCMGDWRYPHGRNDTPWYPTMRLFRQSKLGDWQGVFRRMRSALEKMLANQSPACKADQR